MKAVPGTRAIRRLLLSLSLLAASVAILPVSAANAATSPTLGAAGSYSVLGATTVTNTGPTTMPGDLGVFAGSACTGFQAPCTGGGPGIVGPPGTIHAADANAGDAQAANTAAFGALIAGPNAACTSVPAELGGQTLAPGVYCPTVGDFQLTAGILALSPGTYIFQTPAGLTTAAGGTITGGDPCNVWWRVPSSATIGSGSAMVGNILALTSVSLGSGATLNGRAFAQTGAVTLNNNVITGAACLTANTGSGTPTTTPAAPTAVPAAPRLTG